MSDNLPIHDLWIHPLALEDEGGVCTWHVLDFDDHVLSRLGSLQALRLLGGTRTPFRVHDTCDEVWGLIEGEANCVWHDLRDGSPSYDTIHRMKLAQPTTLLAPFGVAFGIKAVGGPALLVRVMTLSDEEAGQARVLSWPAGD